MIPYGRYHIDEEDIQAVAECVGAKYALAVSSGTAGLHFATLEAGVSPQAYL